jgi:single-strand DNA-binding protein
MKSNHVTLVGYVGSHLNSKKTEKGLKRVAIRMATHFYQRDETGRKHYQTIWHDVVAWNKVADFAERNLVKGSRIMVDGSITYRTYPDKSGHLRYLTMITADSVMNLDR